MRADSSIGVDPTVAPAEPRAKTLTDLVGSTLVGRYEVGELLGEGAMGAVFRGRHLGLARDVAIKVLRPEFTQHRQIAARFEREAQVVSRLAHPGIVQVFDFGPEPRSALDRPIVFIVMELLSGRELRAALGKPIDPALALRRTEQMLEGIAHAHERGVIHRDLKPENVFVTIEPSGEEQLKLVDFGIAKLLESGGPALTQMGMVFGTPSYMSPEQAIGGATDERADVYAVGIILYEMLRGQPPFVDDDIGVLLRRQIQEDPRPIEGLHPAVQRLLDRMLAKSADDRIASAGEAIEAVRAARVELQRPPAVPESSPSVPGPGRGTEIALPDPKATASASSPGGLTTAADTAISGQHRATTLSPIGLATTTLSRLRAIRADPSRRWLPLAAAAGALVLVGIIWAAASDDEPQADSAAYVAAPSPVELLQDAIRSRAPDEDLAKIDALLTDEKWQAAAAKIDALVEEYPDDGRLLWRRGRQLRGKGVSPAERGKVFAEAVRLEPSLLDDEALRQELARELAASQVGDELVQALSEHRNAPDLLLQLALRTKNALSYRMRHVVLEAVGRDPAQAKKIDRAMHRCLDIWQAGEATDPCGAYRQALDAMAAKPDAAHLGTLMWATPPKSCSDLADRQAEIRTAHQQQFPGVGPTLPPDFESKRPKKKRRRRGIFGIFR